MIVRKRERNTNSGHGRMTPMSNTGPGDFPMEFEAVLTDYPASRPPPRFHWETSDGNLRILTPQAQRTLVTADSLPSWRESRLSVTADFGNDTLLSELVFHYGIYEEPQVHLSVSVPDSLLLVDDWMPGSQSAMAHVAVHSDIETNGSVRVSVTTGTDKVSVGNGALGEHSFSGACDYGLDFTIDGIRTSDAIGDILLSFEFIDADGNAALTDTRRVTVVHPVSIFLPAANNGLAVVKNSSITANLNVLPSVSGLTVEWLTARRKTESVYDPWVIVQTGTTEESLLMQTSGVFALQARVICGTQSNRVEYLHTKTEPYCPEIKDYMGPCRVGTRDHVGVASSQALLTLRNVALSHLGKTEYTLADSLPAKNGFSKVRGMRWKCNAFVANMAFEASLSVPIQHRVPHSWPIPDSTFPPVANEWALGSSTISGWVFLGNDCYPEPGFIAGHPNPGGLGHVGIVDYDGWTISAREFGISRNSKKMLDGTCGYNRPMEE